MDNFECPKKISSEGCKFTLRLGAVRDSPSVGVKECQECSLVIHSETLRGLVDYQSGSRNNWAKGHGERTLKPSNDLARRLAAMVNLSEVHKIEKVLDVGCGDGQAVKKLDKYFQTEGVEPDELARDCCINAGLKVHSNLDSLKDRAENFDAISMFHVIEHIYEPSNLLRQLRELLSSKGILVIETPNSMDALLTVYDCTSFQNFNYWSHHPMLYSATALASLVERSGFSVVENRGIQRYGLENHLYWLSQGKPGGHDIWRDMFDDSLKQEYEKNLISKRRSDTIWLVAIKS